MRLKFAVLALALLLLPSLCLSKELTPIQKAGIDLRAVIVFGTADYFAYNALGFQTDHPKIPAETYRIAHLALQAGITYLLWHSLGFSHALSFNLIWWTGGTDAVFYGWSEAGNGFGHKDWAGRGVSKNLMQVGANWFGWTSVGMTRGGLGNHTTPIPGNALVAQAAVGAVLGIAVSLEF